MNLMSGAASQAFHIREAEFPGDKAAVLEIWREYIASPSVSLEYQDYESEFAALPGKYKAPDGCILLAEIDGRLAGCIALRRADNTICEMRRLYVRPNARGSGMGRKLVAAVIDAARAAGYAEMRLDVLAEFETAQQLYASFGFVDADPIAENPTPGARFLGRALA